MMLDCYQYQCVVFMVDNKIGHVSTSWIVTEDGTEKCWWPDGVYKTDNEINKAVESHLRSNLETWKLFAIRRLGKPYGIVFSVSVFHNIFVSIQFQWFLLCCRFGHTGQGEVQIGPRL